MTKSYLELRLLFWRDQSIRATNLDSPWLLSLGSKHWCEYELLKCAIYYIYLYPRKLSKWISGVEKEWPQDCLLRCHFQFIVFTSVTNADHECFFFSLKKEQHTIPKENNQSTDLFSVCLLHILRNIEKKLPSVSDLLLEFWSGNLRPVVWRRRL